MDKPLTDQLRCARLHGRNPPVARKRCFLRVADQPDGKGWKPSAPQYMPEWLRMLTTHIPADWRDLQTAVASILAQSGFSVQIEKVIQTVRGRAEIDVFGQEAVEGRTYTVLCECKNWAARVPQNVIHGFRTVIGDAGANLGYIIVYHLNRGFPIRSPHGSGIDKYPLGDVVGVPSGVRAELDHSSFSTHSGRPTRHSVEVYRTNPAL